MNPKTYCYVSATIFSVVGLAHLLRLVNGWPVEVGATSIPLFLSWFGLLGPGFLATWGFRSAAANRN